jgi:hypothetical protein
MWSCVVVSAVQGRGGGLCYAAAVVVVVVVVMLRGVQCTRSETWVQKWGVAK